MGYTLAHATKHIHPIDDVACPVARRRLRKLLEITRLMEAGCTRQAALKNQGVSQSTYYEWKALFEAKGMRGLVPKSKRPKTHPGRRRFKEFRAVMPGNREMFSKVYSRATADTARDFLLEAVKRLNIRCIQVDGGSEFRGVFEETCAELGIELLVLRPQNPKLNGLVERANRTVREEFCAH